MIVRLLLALLLASFVVPAAGAAPVCHEAPMTSISHHQAPEQEPDRQMPAHVCVGCVPLADWLGSRIADRILPTTRQPDARIVALDLGGAVAPALPPPRIA